MRDVVVVIPLFNPTREMGDRLADVATELEVVVVDDSPGVTEEAILAELANGNVTVLRHQYNRGVAAALNTGIHFALVERGAASVMTVDQDSILPANYAETAYETLQKNPTAGLAYPEFLNSVAQVGSGAGKDWRALEPIQSGWLLRREAVQDLGDFREELVIDCVDTDYFLRLLDSSWEAVPVFGADLQHSLGQQKVILGRFRYSWHPPLRQHYIVRNRLITARAHWQQHPGWAVRSLVRTAMGMLKALLFGDGRRASFMASARGIRDAASNRTGMISS